MIYLYEILLKPRDKSWYMVLEHDINRKVNIFTQFEQMPQHMKDFINENFESDCYINMSLYKYLYSKYGINDLLHVDSLYIYFGCMRKTSDNLLKKLKVKIIYPYCYYKNKLNTL